MTDAPWTAPTIPSVVALQTAMERVLGTQVSYRRALSIGLELHTLQHEVVAIPCTPASFGENVVPLPIRRQQS